MQQPDLELLRRIRFVKCELQPTHTPVDDGCRVFVQGALPAYLQRREIIEGDSLNLLTITDGEETVFRLLIPCAQNCRTLADPLRPGCRVLHTAAHFPAATVAQLAARGDINISLADRMFGHRLPKPTIYVYSDGSVLLRRFPDEFAADSPYASIVEFIRAHAGDMADSEASSALGKFRLFCAAEHIDAYFEGFLPGGVGA